MSDNNGNYYGDNRRDDGRQDDRTRTGIPADTDNHHGNRETGWVAGSSGAYPPIRQSYGSEGNRDGGEKQSDRYRYSKAADTDRPHGNRDPERGSWPRTTYPPTPYDNSGWNRRDTFGYDQQEQATDRGDYPPTTRSGRQSPYQYSPGSGWQQGSRAGRDRESYEWNFQDYDRVDRNRRRGTARKNRGLVVFTVSLVGILVISLFGLTGYSLMVGRGVESSSESSRAPSLAPSAPARDVAPQTDSGLDLAGKPQVQEAQPVSDRLTIPEIAKLVSPSVVGVSAHNDVRIYEPVSIGSGIVMSADGYIITNAHVIAGGSNYKVQLSDNSPYDAQLIGFDSSTDLAILKIEAPGLTPAVFGDSSQIEVGETVVAIGNPTGLELAGSVTRGIVSAINRQVSTDKSQFNYIQTDAAINPGNSGGALVNEFGQVIGINSAKLVASGYEGIGFAIPITDAKPILDMLMVSGRVTGRVILGIGCNPVTETDSLKYGIPMGLEIQEVYENSDLRGKDIQLGDILTEIDGQRIFTLSDVENILKEHKVDDEVTLKFYRRISTVQSTEFEVTIKLIEN
jgi:serine protease Do